MRARRRCARPAGEGAPVIVRVAGLPLDAVQRFASKLVAQVEARMALQARLDAARAALVERLHDAVPGAEPELRRLLLAVKRDCHNGRGVHRRADDARWSALRRAAGALADEVAAMDREAAALDAALEAAFAAELERQRRALLAPLDRRDFARGLALASPDLFDALQPLRADPGRRDRKAELSLLRYVCRAATKVSPFSTFTAVGLGRATAAQGARGLRLAGEPWAAGSLVRIKRYLVQRAAELLLRYPPFRDGLRVELNDSLAETAPGRFLYLRPHHWEVDAERGTLRYLRDALASVSLSGPLPGRLAALLAGERPAYAALAQALAADSPGGDAGARRSLDRLLDLGVLQFLMPWPAHEAHLEKRLLAHLRTLPAEPGLDALVQALERLVSLEDGFAATERPAAAVREISRAVDAVDAAAVRLAGLDPDAVRLSRAGLYSLYEDVCVGPAREDARPPEAGIADVPLGAVRRAVASARPLVRLSVLLDHRQDFLHTLADVARERWPERAEVGALELLHQVQPLWHDYMKVHLAHWRDKTGAVTTWNPRELPALRSLHRWREEISAALPGLGHDAGGDRHLPPGEIAALLDRAPAGFTDGRGWGAMLMMQPADAEGSLWVVNRLREGTGRFGSRYTPAMAPAARDWYTAHLAARSGRELDGERVELLDVHCVGGDTINVHHPQTARVLVMPDDEAELPPHRRVRLRDLRVAFAADGGPPTLRDAGGQRYLPVNLGLAFEAYLPTLLKFLCLFGPSELGTVLPPRPRRRQGPLAVDERTVVGNLVVHRRSWHVPPGAWAPVLRAGTDAQAFAAANRLRLDWGVPERVFFTDMVSHDFFRRTHKPHYLDFTSPLFLPLVRGLAAAGEEVRLTEMLPAPEACPRDAAGRRRAVEVIVDSLALRRPHSRAAAHPVRAPSGRTPPALAGGQLTPR